MVALLVGVTKFVVTAVIAKLLLLLFLLLLDVCWWS